jgi:hypothetical protein
MISSYVCESQVWSDTPEQRAVVATLRTRACMAESGLRWWAGDGVQQQPILAPLTCNFGD